MFLKAHRAHFFTNTRAIKARVGKNHTVKRDYKVGSKCEN